MARASHSLVMRNLPMGTATFSCTRAATSSGTKKIRRIVSELGRFIPTPNIMPTDAVVIWVGVRRVTIGVERAGGAGGARPRKWAGRRGGGPGVPGPYKWAWRRVGRPGRSGMGQDRVVRVGRSCADRLADDESGRM